MYCIMNCCFNVENLKKKLLFLPINSIIFLKDDQVYMKDTNLLEEYVLNDQGAVFQGSSDHIGAKVWNFAQVLFEPSFDV